MTWVYKQSTGELSQYGVSEGFGYSGTGQGRNNPAMQDVANVGPIPQGNYTIGEPYSEIPGLGPWVMHLDPQQGTETFGRSLFRMHGDDVNHDASHGCIVMGLLIRHAVSASGDKDLRVIA